MKRYLWVLKKGVPAIFLWAICGWAGAETFTVVSNADSGPGTLREAITASNTTTGVQTIAFALSNSITVFSQLDISAPVLIEGGGTTISSQGSTILYLNIGSDGSLIRNLALVKASNTNMAGIHISSNGNTVSGCRIGTDFNDASGKGNYYGIYMTGDYNFIGGDRNQGLGNIITGNSYDGLRMYTSNGNTICGNVVGLDSTMTLAFGNGQSAWRNGVDLELSDRNYIGLPQTGYENIIAGNWGNGIQINSSNSCVLQNNYIGITPGNLIFANCFLHGISLSIGSSNLIGAAEAPVVIGHEL